MKSISRKLLAAVIGCAPMIAPVIALPVLSGCSHEHIVLRPDGDIEAYDPGYYYDADYYDAGGHFHPRHYYYYDGHHWADRDAVPSGYTARERHEAHEQHDVHAEHDDHHDHEHQ